MRGWRLTLAVMEIDTCVQAGPVRRRRARAARVASGFAGAGRGQARLVLLRGELVGALRRADRPGTFARLMAGRFSLYAP